MYRRSLRLALICAITVFPSLGAAQADPVTPTTSSTQPIESASPGGATTPAAEPPAAEPPAAETPAAEPEPVLPQPPATPTPSATGTPSAAPVTAVLAGVAIRLTGIVHAAVYGSQAVESFGQATSVAPTSALNPWLLGAQADDPVLTFQVQQSRFGMVLGEGSPLRATVEIDFVHFDQSSPVAQAYPRIRIAQLEWHLDDQNRIFVGQGWDIFGSTNSALLSHSSNLVGTMFQAGNIGFMRQQLGWSGRFGDFEVALAVGMQGNNTGPTFGNLEESATPTGAARIMYHLTETNVFGISGLGTAPRFTQTSATTMQTIEERRLALGGELFADLTFGPVNVHAEVYVAQNLANTGTLNLGQGRFGHDVADAGGYLSGRLNLGDWSVTAMYGFAGVMNAGEVQPGYTTPTPTPTPPATYPGTTVMATNGTPGMAWNMSGHVGVWFSPMRGLSFVLEPYFYFTRFVYDAATSGVFGTDRLALGGQFVTMFQF